MDGGLDFLSADIALRYKTGQFEHVPLYKIWWCLLTLTTIIVIPHPSSFSW